MIPESKSTTVIKLCKHGTVTIEGNNLQNRFQSGVTVMYEFSIGSSNMIITNLTKFSLIISNRTKLQYFSLDICVDFPENEKSGAVFTA